MTTLAANKPRAKEQGSINSIPVIAADIIFEGAAVGQVKATGHARPLNAADLFVGFAVAKADNSAGSAAAITVDVYRKGEAQLSVSGAVITDIGQPVYATDDDAFVFLPTAAVFIGFVKRFVSSGVVVVAYDVDNFVDPYQGKVKETLAGAALTLDAEDSGKYIFVTVDATVTIPATAVALADVTLVCMGPYGTVQISVDPDNADKLHGPNLAPADGVIVANTKATAQRGDLITLTNGHANGAVVNNIKGVWA